ncbi:MAG: SusD/RagB family nutrient-binding outer membrane lipoprotein [Bacteroidales bacterium]
MKNLIQWLLVLLIHSILFVACDKEEMFGDMNDNPNVASDISRNPELILTALCKDPVNTLVEDSWSEANLMSQYAARIVFTAFDQFEWGSNSGTWNEMYTSIKNTRILLANAKETDNPSYAGCALILDAWIGQILTDMWGDVPYENAGKGRGGIIYPEYDTQESIYNRLIEKLDSANNYLGQPNLPNIKGDLIYDGDLDAWHRFGNSLRLRVYMRLSNVKPSLAQEGIGLIVNDPAKYPVFEDNSHNATLTYLSSQPNTHPLAEASGYRVGSYNEYRMSETVEGVLKDFDDPRLQAWFDPTPNSADSENPVWSGMKNGLVDGVAYTYKGGDAFLSKFNMDFFYFSPNNMEGIIMTYAEVEFILAEAGQRGWLSDAADHYEAGVQASFDYWGVEMPAGYLSRNGVAYDGNLETIITQKWLALFYNDYQSFNDFKRTGYPDVIKPGPNAQLPVYPSRYSYPSDEQALNGDNLSEALQRQWQGSDRYENRVWWEGR